MALFLFEIRAMKEWGLIDNYWQYENLPERVVTLWRLVARAEGDAMQIKMKAGKSSSQPTQDLLANEVEVDVADEVEVNVTA